MQRRVQSIYPLDTTKKSEREPAHKRMRDTIAQETEANQSLKTLSLALDILRLKI